jgi:Ni,Fe-hydrogenase I cytochrome b subunit
MKMTPGIFVGGILLVAVFYTTGSVAQWWAWLTAVAVTMLVDAAFYVEPVRTPKIKTEQTYVKR